MVSIMKKDYRVCVIGLDGVNKQVLELMRLKKDMPSSVLHSSIPPYTPPSWTSILSGVNPGKHGILGWQNVNLKERKIKLNTSFNVKYLRIFETLSKCNLKSIIINAPMTYPFGGISDLRNSIIISDWASPIQSIYPKELYEKYRNYMKNAPYFWYKFSNTKEYSKIIQDHLVNKMEMYYDLLEHFNWNLFFIVFSETDWLLHKIPELLEGRKKSLARPIFREIKKFFKRALEISDLVFIVSDHGFEMKNLEVSINVILKKNNQIKINYMKSATAVFMKKIIPSELLNKWLRYLSERSSISKSSVAFETDLLKSNAFMNEPATWGLYVNRNMHKIIKILDVIPEINSVVSSKEVYKGPLIEQAPNLILIPQKGVAFSKKLSGEIYKKIHRGDHEYRGVLSVAGDGINEKVKFNETPKVYDITPTILHVFGLPIPNDVDGRVLTEIFRPKSKFAIRSPIYTDSDYYKKQEEKTRIKSRIRDLGFEKQI